MIKSLTRAEEQVMQVLWELKQGFLKDLMEKIPPPKPHSNTVATILKILIEKGFVTHQVEGRNNLYQPTISKEEYGKRSINQVIKGYFEDSPAKLVSHFVNDQQLSLEELEALLQEIKKHQQNNL